jgi:SAM-dependent methyltransferase
MTQIELPSRYTGSEGEAYFRWQAEIGRAGARLNRWRFLPFLSGTDIVLDFGCGGGFLLAGLPALDRLGIEINPAARQVAEANGLATYPSLEELEAASVDVVISNHALEHTPDPFAELRGILRTLRPGGRLVLWLPLNDWRSDRRVKNDPSCHLYAWTSLTLRNLLSAAGFEVHACKVVTHAWSLRLASLESRVPSRLFDLACRTLAVVRRRRQLMALASRPVA